MNTDFEFLIESNHSLLTKNEKRIASFIFDNPSIVIDNDIIKASEEMFVSKSTLTRFCLKIGLENYKELRYVLKQNITKNSRTDKNFDTIIDAFYDEYTSILSKLKLMVDDRLINQAVTYIANSKQTYIVGIGQSGFLAQDFALRLRRMGLNITALSDIHIIKMACSICTPDDLFIFISNSGKTKIVNQALNQINEIGGKSILLTEFNQSNATKNSTLTILTPQKTNLSLSNSISDTFGLQLISDLIFHHLYSYSDVYAISYQKTLINHDEI